MTEAEKIKQLLDEQVNQLKQKREEVLAKVKSELDDIDAALRQLGEVVRPAQISGAGKKKKREKIDDKRIMELLRSFMQPGTSYSAAEILKKLDLKAGRFSSFKAGNKDFLKTQGAKRSMRYSLNA
jgi:hypothetical protein